MDDFNHFLNLKAATIQWNLLVGATLAVPEEELQEFLGDYLSLECGASPGEVYLFYRVRLDHDNIITLEQSKSLFCSYLKNGYILHQFSDLVEKIVKTVLRPDMSFAVGREGVVKRLESLGKTLLTEFFREAVSVVNTVAKANENSAYCIECHPPLTTWWPISEI